MCIIRAVEPDLHRKICVVVHAQRRGEQQDVMPWFWLQQLSDQGGTWHNNGARPLEGQSLRKLTALHPHSGSSHKVHIQGCVQGLITGSRWLHKHGEVRTMRRLEDHFQRLARQVHGPISGRSPTDLAPETRCHWKMNEILGSWQSCKWGDALQKGRRHATQSLHDGRREVDEQRLLAVDQHRGGVSVGVFAVPSNLYAKVHAFH
mmetsp:Transcript_40828/g.129304  ORF Transcript_40828/g.129304 Transcript_40828/m.129304 type:complete len:205 (-) Transcript_40828:1026-1640(-)